MKKKKKHTTNQTPGDFDPELLRMYMMGATNPRFSNKVEFNEEVVDLHLEKMSIGTDKIPPQDALFHQLENFETCLDKAIAAGKLEIRVIHGLGKGKLREEIFKILRKHPNVRSFENDFHSRYGYGSTLILLK
ncbi:MAG: Smr protein/MutS2 [Bacteroidota bacterium]|nr:Smr protein/MutS2 [Bacteroidota bacterium]